MENGHDWSTHMDYLWTQKQWSSLKSLNQEGDMTIFIRGIEDGCRILPEIKTMEIEAPLDGS